jgi:hypothetical protein
MLRITTDRESTGRNSLTMIYRCPECGGEELAICTKVWVSFPRAESSLKTLGKLSRRSATRDLPKPLCFPTRTMPSYSTNAAPTTSPRYTWCAAPWQHAAVLSDPTFPPIDLWLLLGLLLVGDPISWRTLCKRGQPVAFDSRNGRGGTSATTHHRQDPDIRPQQQYDDVSRTPGAGDPAQPQGNRKMEWRLLLGLAIRGHTRQPVTEAKPPESDASRKGTTRAMKARLLDEAVHCEMRVASAILAGLVLLAALSEKAAPLSGATN